MEWVARWSRFFKAPVKPVKPFNFGRKIMDSPHSRSVFPNKFRADTREIGHYLLDCR